MFYKFILLFLKYIFYIVRDGGFLCLCVGQVVFGCSHIQNCSQGNISEVVSLPGVWGLRNTAQQKGRKISSIELPKTLFWCISQWKKIFKLLCLLLKKNQCNTNIDLQNKVFWMNCTSRQGQANFKGHMLRCIILSFNFSNTNW